VRREAVVEELRRVADELGKPTVSRREFARHGRFNPSVIERAFGSWSKALTSAGLQVTSMNVRLTDEQLAEEFHKVRQELGKVPTRSEFAAHSNHSPTVYERRFGRWSKAVEHYAGPTAGPAAARKAAHPRLRGVEQRRLPTSSAEAKSRNKRTFGPPLNFRGLQHEPVNEQGVVFLFGIVASDLGFLVEAVQTGYPDCRAKRRTRGGNYVEVDIEFEFRSRNFREQGHDPQKCDLIVCWEDDWPDCPLEILELKSAIRDLDPTEPGQPELKWRN
jgi:hypothetical protein